MTTQARYRWIYMLCLLGFAGVALAQEAKQSFHSCGLIASRLLTIAQLQHKGFSEADVVDALPIETDTVRDLFASIEQQGLLTTYSAINAQYNRCATEVYERDGKPLPTGHAYAYYFCAGENKLRYQVLLAYHVGGERDQVKQQTPESRRRMVDYLYDHADEHGLLGAFDASANLLKQCLEPLF